MKKLVIESSTTAKLLSHKVNEQQRLLKALQAENVILLRQNEELKKENISLKLQLRKLFIVSYRNTH